MNACALCVAAEVQRAYRDFRFERGVVTYADQVALAVELMRQPDVARRIREKNYRVILDEAQDTDPQQFFVLLEITRPWKRRESGAKRAKSPPRPGHFCMVGDFQQSIYRDPADLARYRVLHERLIEDRRCGRAQVLRHLPARPGATGFRQRTFPENSQQLCRAGRIRRAQCPPGILAGQAIRLDLGSEVDLSHVGVAAGRAGSARAGGMVAGRRALRSCAPSRGDRWRSCRPAKRGCGRCAMLCSRSVFPPRCNRNPISARKTRPMPG